MKVLVVDDISITRALLRQMLTRANQDVVEAANVQEAVQHLKSSKVDLVITDLALPDGDGMTVLEEAVVCETKPPVLLFTASSDEKTIESARAAGFAKVLQKPLSNVRIMEILSTFAKK